MKKLAFVLLAQMLFPAYKTVNHPTVLLAPGDFTLLGYYNVPLGGNMYFGTGITHRFVAADLRFIVREYYNTVSEFSISGVSYGDTITTRSNYWSWGDCYGETVGQFFPVLDMTWVESRNALWTTASQDYSSGEPSIFCEHTLGASDHTWTTTHSNISLEGILSKATNTGFGLVPSWFKAQYHTADYTAGYGGYQSGNSQCMGLCLFIIPSIADYADDSAIPEEDFKVSAIHASTGSPDWYADGHPTVTDRGNRSGRVANYVNQPTSAPLPILFPSLANGPMDRAGQQPIQWNGHVDTAGTAVTRLTGLGFTRCQLDDSDPDSCWWIDNVTADPPKVFTIGVTPYTVESVTDNDHLTLTSTAGTQSDVAYVTPSTRPWVPIADGAEWLSPDPLGNNKWSHGDGNNGNGCTWITGTNKHGFVCMENHLSGNAGVSPFDNCDIAGVGYIGCVWYASGLVESDGQEREWHVYDPTDLGRAANGDLEPFNVQPVNMAPVTLEGVTTTGLGPFSPDPIRIQIDYVPETNRIYALAHGNIAGGVGARLFVYSVDDSAAPRPIWPLVSLGFAALALLPTWRGTRRR